MLYFGTFNPSITFIIRNVIFFTLFYLIPNSSSKTLFYSIKENLGPTILDENVATSNQLNSLKVLNSFEDETDCDEDFSARVVYYASNSSLQTIDSLDREKCALYKATVLDLSFGETYTIEVSVLDVDDHSPRFTRDTCNLSIYEATIVDSEFYLKSDCTPSGFDVVDEDGEEFGIQKFEIESGNEGGYFELETQSMEPFLVLKKKLDVDGANGVESFSITIAVEDGATNRATAIISITVLDSNDNRPEFQFPTYQFEVNETSLPGTPVGTVRAFDADSGDNANITYFIPTQTGEKPFSISTETGEITVSGKLDHERASVIELKVGARDNPVSEEVSRSSEVVVTISVVDENEHPPEITFTFYFEGLSEGLISESFEVGNTIAEVEITDRDSYTAAVSLELKDINNAFVLKPCLQSDCIELAEPLDRETKDFYSFALIATETVSPFRSVTRYLNFTVLDSNDNYPHFDPTTLSFVIEDNSESGTFVGQVAATDADLENIISYTFAESSSMFIIDQSTGIITTSTQISCSQGQGLQDETVPIKLQVRATDSSPMMPLTSVETITINLSGLGQLIPTFIPSSSYSATVTEGSEIGTCFISVKASLQSCVVVPLVYKLENTMDDLFSINETDGLICLNSSPDFEQLAMQNRNSPGLVQLRVVASASMEEGQSPHYEVVDSVATISVQIQDENEFKPEWSQKEYVEDIAYSTRVNSLVALVLASDQDGGPLYGKVFYSIHSGNNQGIFHINNDTGHITLSKPMPLRENLPADSTFVLLVSVEDGGGLQAEESANVILTITGLDITAPVFSPSLYFFNATEGPQGVTSDIGTVFATYNSDNSNDVGGSPTESDELVYELQSSKHSDLFSVSSNSGVVKVLSELDAELSSMYLLTVAAYSSTNPDAIAYCQIEVNLLDVNDMQPIFYQTHITFQLREDEPLGTVFGSVQASDADISSPNNLIVYSVSPEDNSFDVLQNGDLVTNAVLDREQVASMSFTVVATDSGTPKLSSSILVNIVLIDVNDNAPKFFQQAYVFDVDEDIELFEQIGYVNATDSDIGSNSQIIYSLRSSNPEALSVFGIDSLTGVLYVVRYLDHEEESSYEFEVVATDLGAEVQLSGTADVVVFILDANDEVPHFNSSKYSFSVQEGAGTSSAVGRVFATDNDVGVNGQILYSIAVNGNGAFTIDPVSGVISLTEVLDREQTSLHIIEVKATDGGEPQKWDSALVYVHVTEVNDEAPVCESEVYEVLLHELVPNSTLVATVHATDTDDVGPNSQIVYSLDGETSEETSGVFEIDEESGQIRLISELDYETQNSHLLTVNVRDKGAPSLSSTCKVEITVIDDNEFGPVFETDPVEFEISEDIEPGSTVGFVKATDRDYVSDVVLGGGSGNGTSGVHSTNSSFMRYFLVVGFLGLFSVDPVSGEIYTNKPIDYEQTPLSKLVVRAIDTKSTILPSLDPLAEHLSDTTRYRSADVNVIIRAKDKNDNTPVFKNKVLQILLREGSKVGSVLGTVVATDADSGLNGKVEYSIFDQSPPGFVSIDATLGTLVLEKKVDYETMKNYIGMVIMAKDLPLNEADQRYSYCTVTVQIVDENDNKPIFKGPFTINVNEDLDTEFSFYKVEATDLDSGDNGLVKYYLNTHTDVFNLVPDTGLLFLKQSVDREKVDSYNLSITARDGGEPPFKTTQWFVVNVLDVNDNPVRFVGPFNSSDSNLLVAHVSENLPEETIVTTIEVEDADLNDKITFELEAVLPEDQNSFSLDAQTGVLRTMKSLDTETKSVYSFTVYARDSSGNIQHQAVTPMKVFVDNQNDFPPIIQNCPREINVLEEQEDPLSEQFRAQDDDKSVNGVIKFSLKPQPNEKENLNDKFFLQNHDNEESATLKLVSTLDREQRSSYTFFVVAEDHGTPVKNSSCQVTVNIIDINDNAPILNTSVSPEGANNTFKLYEETMQLSKEIKIIAIDPDKDNQQDAHIAFAIKTCSCGEGIFKIDQTSGVVSLFQPLDHEKMKRCVLNISGTDDGGKGLTSYIEITVTTINMNDNAPVFPGVIQRHFNEPPVKDRDIATLVVDDADADGDKYPIMFGFPNGSTTSTTTDDFYLDGDFNQLLKARRQLTKSSYLFLVQAIDGNKFTATGLVDITIGSEPPERLNFTMSSYHASIDENKPEDTEVIQVEAHFLNTASVENGSVSDIKYSLFSPTVDGALKIDSTSGVISVDRGELLDYEEVQQITTHVQATATITAGGTGGEVEDAREIVGYTTVVVELNNLNDNIPHFISAVNTTSIPEGHYSLDNPVAVQDIQVRDFDERSNALKLSIVSIEPVSSSDAPPVFKFQHHLLLAVGNLDRESVDQYTVTIRVTDSQQPTHSVDRILTIDVSDENDNPPIFPDNVPPSISIPENFEVGKIIGTYKATDADSESHIKYDIIYRKNDKKEPRMFIMDENANLILNRPLDYEERSDYMLTLRASDGDHTNERELLLKVEDVNDNTPVFQDDIYEAKIDSGIPVGTNFRFVFALDLDSGVNGKITYSITDDKLGAFKINATSGELGTKMSLEDMKKDTVKFITVKAEDGGQPRLSSSVRVSITIITQRQANELPIIMPMDTVSVPEDTKVNSAVAQIKGHFPDHSTSSYIKYKLVSGNKNNTFKLVLEAQSQLYGAVLILAKTLDRELIPEYNLQVMAYDERNPTLQSTSSIKIQVKDVNDNVPFFVDSPYRTNISADMDVGKAIVKVQAVDRDEKGSTNSLTYEIIAGNKLSSFFSIDPITGWIKLKKSLQSNVGEQVKLTVSATDPNFTATTNVFINVLKPNLYSPRFPKKQYTYNYVENAPQGFAFLMEVLNGLNDKAEGAVFQIVDSDVQDMFYVDPYSGVVEFATSPDYETKSNYTFHLKASNSFGEDITTINVGIIGIDEYSPEFQESYSFSIPADAPAGTKVGQVVAVDKDAGKDGVVVYKFTKDYPNFIIDPHTGNIYINNSLTQEISWIPENSQPGTSSVVLSPLIVEASSGRQNSLHKIEAVGITVEMACCPSLIPASDSDKDPLSGIILAVIVVSIVVVLVVAGIATLACVFHRTKNQGGHHQSSISGSPTHESFQNGFLSINRGVSPTSTPSRNSSTHIYPNPNFPLGAQMYNHPNSHRSNGSSGHGSAMNNEADCEIKLINERNYLHNAKTPDFQAYQKDSGFNDMPDNVSIGSVAQNIAEVIFGDDDHHVYASASIESVHPFADEAGRTGMSSLIYSKLHEIGADQFDPHKGIQGSFNSLVGGQDIHENYNWDHLLNWNPQYHQLAQVFSDIAKLKDDGGGSPGALPEPVPQLFNNQNNRNQNFSPKSSNQQYLAPSSKNNTPPPFLTNMAQPGNKAVHPVAYKQQNDSGRNSGGSGIVNGHPNSRAGYPMPSPQQQMQSIPFHPSYNNNNATTSTQLALNSLPPPDATPAYANQPTLTKTHPRNPNSNSSNNNKQLSNGSLAGSTSSSSSGSANHPANHKSLSKQHQLAMGVNSANAAAAARNQRQVNSAKSRPYIREEQV